jgi:glycosyltransferase involved in cell wall biosynthesis
MKVSIVIPVYNGEKNIKSVYHSIKYVMENLNFDYEIIYVDDGSIDKSFEILKNLKRNEKNLKIIKLKKNYGQHPALFVGIKNSSGDIIITFDNDLEISPSLIPEFINMIKSGEDIVSGVRKKRNLKLIRKFSSYLFNLLISILSRVRINDCGCPLKAFNQKIAKEIIKYGDIPSFFPHLKNYKFSQIIIPVNSVKDSSYNFWKLLKLAVYSLKNFFFQKKYILEPEIENFDFES